MNNFFKKLGSIAPIVVSLSVPTPCCKAIPTKVRVRDFSANAQLVRSIIVKYLKICGRTNDVSVSEELENFTDGILARDDNRIYVVIELGKNQKAPSVFDKNSVLSVIVSKSSEQEQEVSFKL